MARSLLRAIFFSGRSLRRAHPADAPGEVAGTGALFEAREESGRIALDLRRRECAGDVARAGEGSRHRAQASRLRIGARVGAGAAPLGVLEAHLEVGAILIHRDRGVLEVESVEDVVRAVRIGPCDGADVLAIEIVQAP